MSSDEQITPLVRKRGQVKAKLKSFKEFLLRISPSDTVVQLSEVDTIQLHSRFTVFSDLLAQFEIIHTDLINVEKEENLEKRMKEFTSFEKDYYETVAQAKLLMKNKTLNFEIQGQVNIAAANSDSPDTTTNNKNNVQLPTLKIQTYKGEPEQFLCFYESFKSLVHNNEKLDDISRFLYLKSCLGEEPLKVIESLEVSASNYQIALRLIEKRYKNTKLIIHSHIKGIVEHPKIIKESAISLRQLSDSLQAHLRALESLGEPVGSWSSIIQYLVTDKLDYHSKREWEIEISKCDTDPDSSNLIEFLEKRCALLEKVEKHSSKINNSISNQNKNKLFSKNQNSSFSHVSANRGICYHCQGEHKIYCCKQFLDLSVQNRIAEVKKLQLCFNCLKAGHGVDQCKSSHCKQCSEFHSSLLHQDKQGARFQSTPQPNVNNTDMTKLQSSTTLTSNIRVHKTATQILPTAIIYLYDNKGNSHKCTALLDSASMRSYMTISLCNKLKLPTKRVNIPVSGISQGKSRVSKITNGKIKSLHGNFSADISFLLLQNITDHLPANTNLGSIDIPDNIILANPNFYCQNKIDILLGVDIFWQLLLPDQPLANKFPYLHNTHLGYVISGQFGTDSSESSTLCHLTTIDLSRQLSQFWELENINVSKPLSSEEIYCETHFNETTKRDTDGRFIVSIPLGSSPSVLGDSKENARRQFLSLEKRLNLNQKLKTMYIDFMNEYIELEHMTPVCENSDSVPQYYIPHHAVYKEHSLTTKLRVVFNSSAPSSSGVSLNDIQLNGPILQNDLFSILIRFRRFKYAISADCSKMYRSIWVDKSQRPLERIFWRENPSLPLKVYELCTVTYGKKASSFLAIRCLFELANQCETSHPNIATIIRQDMYCDDLLTSCSNLSEASKTCSDISHILQSGGFTLRKWSSNFPEVLTSVKFNDIENNILDFGPTENSRTLGLLFNSYSDEFFYSVTDIPHNVATKRVVLSFISMLFDPLGLLSPCTIASKIFMQTLWLSKIGWDDPLPSDLHNKWIQYTKELPLLNTLRIKRQVVCNFFKRIEIHAFSDASQKAYGTCIYIRSIDNENNVLVNLLCSKTKVSPLKSITIPKLELCGALMMARLVDKVKKHIGVPIHETFYWTDSTIVLSWVKTQPHLLDVFTSNRVAQVQDISDPSNWFYVPTAENPADILTRGISPQLLQDCSMWWYGPSFISQLNISFPFQRNSDSSARYEASPQTTSLVVSHPSPSLFPFERFSSFNTLTRVMAYCLRFITNCRATKGRRKFGFLTTQELHDSVVSLTVLAQKDSFPEEYEQVVSGKSLHKKNKLSSLTPFLHSDKTLRVCGRLKNSNFDFSKKHPMIISASHHLSKLLFRNEHDRLIHAGPQHLLNSIRERFWPVGGRNLAKKTVFNCITCFKARPRDIQNLLDQLPADRVTPQFPFAVTGTDYCGPFQIRDRKGRGFKPSKCWVCIFICFSTKAIHLEPVTDLTAEAFIMCLRRFTSRRCMPNKIYSDNGRTYLGAYSELKDLGSFLENNKDALEEQFNNHNFNWSFLPPYSPNIGGLWEAGVKSFKFHFKRVLKNTILTYEQFYSVVVQIEGILNSRPISSLSSSPDDLLPLTPAHFLTGRPITTVPDPSVQHIPENKLSLYQRLQHITQSFWARWSKEFISSLQQRFKWKIEFSNIQVGTLVLLKDDNLPPTKWRLGRVVQLHHGVDNLVRIVSVRTQQGVTRRAISKVCPLPIDDSSSTLPTSAPKIV